MSCNILFGASTDDFIQNDAATIFETLDYWFSSIHILRSIPLVSKFAVKILPSLPWVSEALPPVYSLLGKVGSFHHNQFP